MSKLYELYKKNNKSALISTCAYFFSDRIQPLWDKNRRYICKTAKKDNSTSGAALKKTMSEIKIAYVCDEMTFQSFSGETQSVYLTPWNWYEVLEREQPDVFFCESAWTGIKEYEGCWRGRIYKSCNVKYNNRKVLFQILDYCQKKHITTVFWNKEDPTYFGNKQYDFIDTALKFDYIFTTCKECVEEYQKLGHKKVGTLPFGVSTRIYNPMDSGAKENVAIFAGSWYPEHKQRCIDMEKMFEQVLQSGIELKIYDRNYNNQRTVNHFPAKYEPYILGYIPFEEMGKVIKHARYAININSVLDSETMFARRVFEMMASNVCLISNESLGMRKMFTDRVWFVGEEFDRENINEICRENVQDVLKHHTNQVRMRQLLSEIGLLNNKNQIRVGVVTEHMRPKETGDLLEVTYYPTLDELPRTMDYFIIEKEIPTNIDALEQMVEHYQYLDENVGVFFAKNRYRMTKSNEKEDTLFPAKMLGGVIEGKHIMKYGI